MQRWLKGLQQSRPSQSHLPQGSDPRATTIHQAMKSLEKSMQDAYLHNDNICSKVANEVESSLIPCKIYSFSWKNGKIQFLAWVFYTHGEKFLAEFYLGQRGYEESMSKTKVWISEPHSPLIMQD